MYCGLEGLFLRESLPLQSMRVSYFWCKGCCQYGCLPCLSSMYAGCYPLDRGSYCFCGDQSLHWKLSGASLLCACHSLVGTGSASQLLGWKPPYLFLSCGVRQAVLEHSHWESLSIPPQELSTGKCDLWCHLSPIVRAQNIHHCWHCPQALLSHGNAGSQAGCPSGAVLTRPPAPIHWHRIRRGGALPASSTVRVRPLWRGPTPPFKGLL